MDDNGIPKDVIERDAKEIAILRAENAEYMDFLARVEADFEVLRAIVAVNCDVCGDTGRYEIESGEWVECYEGCAYPKQPTIRIVENGEDDSAWQL